MAPRSRRLRLSGVAGTLLLITALAACGGLPTKQAGETGATQPRAAATSATSSSSSRASTAQPDPVSLTANVKDGSTKVPVDTLVTVSAGAGTVTSVKLGYTSKDRQGQTRQGVVLGTISKGGRTWTAAGRLEPAAHYSLTMAGKNTANQTSRQSTSFGTTKLSLAEQTFSTLYPLNGMHIGVGMPAVLTFDVAVTNKREFEKNLQVISSPAQTGSWRWFGDREVRFRPKHYWKPGTKVTVKADLNGLNAGRGVYGQNSATTTFTVGRSLITKINLATDVAHVYRNGKKVRTIYVSGGKLGWETRSGTKLIMGKEYTHKMTNQMIGAKEHYDLNVHYAMRVTNSGEFLHAAPWNAANFGRRNASHGCVGMSTGDAAWLYSNALIGDPVVTTGTSRGLELGNGYSDWNVPYAQYKKGSAL